MVTLRRAYLNSIKKIKIMADTFIRSRQEILHYILQFTMQKYYGEKKEGYEQVVVNVECAWRGGFCSSRKPPIGSLCILTSCATTKWYLSWLVEYKAEGGFGGNWLMKSVEDGSLCWWTNVGMHFLPLEESNKFPSWKWSDAQYAFHDKWAKACKKRDAYITLGTPPHFDENGGVTIGTRTRFGWDDYRPTKHFPNWKKVTIKQMLEFYDECVANRPKKETTTTPNP